MLVIDTSAIFAVLNREPEHFNGVVAACPRPLISAATYVEAGIVARAQRGAAGLHTYYAYVARAQLEIVPVDSEQAEVAIEAYARFGKGRNPAGLNYGDCFSYALAWTRDLPLLFKGDNFARTDIEAAVGS